MKEMYLKVEVTQYDDYGEIFEVFYRNGRSFYTRKGDEKLVDIKDAEERGAEKLCKAISDICFSDGVDIKNAFDGYCGMTGIIGNFKPEEIVQRAEKLNVHVPTTGDIYVSRKSGNKVAVLSYNEETRRVRFMGGSYITNGSVEDFNKMFLFTGCVYDSFYNIVNELYSEEGDNT